MPVEVELTFDDGSTARKPWDGHSRWQWVDTLNPKRLRAAEADPDAKILLDDDLTNNAKTRERGTTLRLTERISYWASLVFSVLGP